jgi:purine nucleoside permease
VLGIVTGEGAERGAASIVALGSDPRFDLRRAYWVVAGIAGVDPNAASVGSAAWANWVVNARKPATATGIVVAAWRASMVDVSTSKSYSVKR